MNWIIIAAGGNGERIKLPYNKIFYRIGNKPLIYWTLKNFEDNALIDKIIIVVKKKEMKKVKEIVKRYRFKKIDAVITASHTRQDSTLKVLKQYQNIFKSNDLIGVHNAVNPFVLRQEIEKVYQMAKKYGSALLAQPAKDTIKISSPKHIVKNTPLRLNCWYAQTPQVAVYKHMFKAFLQAEKDQFIGTDDTQLLERINILAKIVPCSSLNFKITYIEDLLLVKDSLKNYLKQNG